MTKRKRPHKPHSSKRGPSGPPPHLAANAAAEALRRATLAAASGKLTTADREMRLAERLGKLALNPPPPGDSEDENDGEAFRRELEHRINRHRAAERAALDDMKRRDPAAWQAAFDSALEKAITQARESTIAYWTGNPHLFEEEAPAEHADGSDAHPSP